MGTMRRDNEPGRVLMKGDNELEGASDVIHGVVLGKHTIVRGVCTKVLPQRHAALMPDEDPWYSPAASWNHTAQQPPPK